ncbi:MAG: hypothetical protein COA69_12310 [Robiginitomaculum sp.]|nr:MAG: hypothetical protein COA69_12310 [Robiginitomaculum sp.]
MIRLITCFVLLMVFLPCNVFAQEDKYAKYAAPDFIEKFSKNFIGHCVQTMPRVDKVESAARVFEWRELNGDMAKILAPQDPSSWFKAWLIEIEPKFSVMLGVSIVETENPPVAVCSIANPYAPSKKVLATLRKYLTFPQSPIADDSSGGQRMRIWKYDELVVGSLIVMTDSTKLNEAGTNLTVIVPRYAK